MSKGFFQVGLFLCAFGIFIFFGYQHLIDYKDDKPLDICEDGLESISQIKEGFPVDTEVNVLMESYVTQSVSTGRRYGWSTDDYSYYIMPVYIGEDMYLVSCSYKEGDDYYKKAEAVADATMDYLNSRTDVYGQKSVRLKGHFYILDKELYQYMKDWVRDSEIYTSESEINKYVLQINISSESVNGKRMYRFGMAAIVIGVICIIIALMKAMSYKKYKYIVNNESEPVDEYAIRIKQLQALGDKSIEIGGETFLVSRLTFIDKKILSGDISGAKDYMINIYNATEEEANSIIAKWDEITSP